MLSDMREKIKEYISELDAEIDKCEQLMIKHLSYGNSKTVDCLEVKVKTLKNVRENLIGRLEEVA